MRFFCITRSRLEGVNRALQQACDARDVPLVSVAPGAVWRPLAGGPEAGDLLYRAADDRVAERVEALLLAPGVATFHTTPGFRCSDPLATFVRARLPVPRTVLNLVRHPEALASCAQALGGFPLLLRLPDGGADGNLVRVDDRERLVQLAQRHAGPAALQQLVAHERALHLVVVGDEVVACVERRPGKGDFRSDGPGATSRAASPPLGASDLARRAVALLGLELGGVDLMVDRDSDLVLAGVDFPCAFASVQEVTGVDIAGAMLDHLIGKARAPGGS